MKNILVISFSQTGQTEEIAQNISLPLSADPDCRVVYYTIELKEPFPFPWNKHTFYQAFPESFLQIPSEILPPPSAVLENSYDLVIFAYQVWYLTPSIPIISFLKSEYASQLLNGTKVVTVVACRNMWATSHDKINALLKQNGAERVGNIALVDRTNNYISVYTIVEWLYSGKKEKKGIFPAPGVDDQEIKESVKFGRIIANHLNRNNFDGLQEDLLAEGAVNIKPFLVTVDKTANRIFRIWSGKIISTTGEKRKKLLVIFKYYLLFAIYIVSPIVLLFWTLLYPFRWRKVKKEIKYYKGI